jgi:hypothetical protein
MKNALLKDVERREKGLPLPEQTLSLADDDQVKAALKQAADYIAAAGKRLVVAKTKAEDSNIKKQIRKAEQGLDTAMSIIHRLR